MPKVNGKIRHLAMAMIDAGLIVDAHLGAPAWSRAIAGATAKSENNGVVRLCVGFEVGIRPLSVSVFLCL